jgi:hypothetical protein
MEEQAFGSRSGARAAAHCQLRTSVEEEDPIRDATEQSIKVYRARFEFRLTDLVRF